MSQFRIAIELSCLRQPFKQALLTAAKLDADAVAIDARGEIRPSTITATGIRQLNKFLDDLRLKVASVTFQTRRGYHIEDDLERRITATKQAMDFAYALGCNVVTNQVGMIPAEEQDPALDILRSALTDIGRYGQRCGVFLAARTGGEPAEALRRLIDALPEGSLAVDFDPGNLIVNGFSASQALPILVRDIVHVHARDGVRDLARGRGLEVALGRGSVDFAELVALLDQHGFRGYLTVERSEAAHPQLDIANAVSYLRELI